MTATLGGFDRRAHEVLQLLLDHEQFVTAMAQFDNFEESAVPVYAAASNVRDDGALRFGDDDDADDGEAGVQALMIVGASGTGKSGVLRKIRSRPGYRSDRSGPDGDVRPVISFKVPDNPTPMEVVREIAAQLNTPLLRHWTRGEISRHLREVFRQVRLRHIQMDEAHVFVQELTPRQILVNARFLKFLLVSCGVPIILAGEEPLELLLQHKALNRRTHSLIRLGPYVWRDAPAVEEWMSLANNFAGRLGFQGLDLDVDLAARLYLDTGGIIGLLAKRMIEAARLAQAASEQLDTVHFSRAWGKWSGKAAAVISNPFDIAEKASDVSLEDPYVLPTADFVKLWAARFGGVTPPPDASKPTRRRGPREVKNRSFGR